MNKCLFSVVCWLLIVFLSSNTWAQRSRVDVKIRSLKINSIVTPVYQDSKEGSRGANGRWCRFDLEFDTAGREWISEVEVRWFAMVETDAVKRYSALMLNTFFTDVKEGKHFVSSYIRPKFFERYMKSKRLDTTKVSIYAEIWIDGQRVAREEKKSHRAPEKWYSMGDKMNQFSNDLLPKSKTPFAPLDFDYYEYEKVN